MNWVLENPQLSSFLDEFNFRRSLGITSDEYKSLDKQKKAFWGALIEAEQQAQEKEMKDMKQKMKRHR